MHGADVFMYLFGVSKNIRAVTPIGVLSLLINENIKYF